MPDRYRGGGSLGGKVGCGAAALVGGPLFFILVLVNSLGDCVQGTQCHHGSLFHVFLPVVAVALPTGLGVRALVNRFWKRR